MLALLILIGGTMWVSVWSSTPTTPAHRQGSTAPSSSAAGQTPLHTDFAVEPKTLTELLNLSVDQLAQVDIARMNLLCATGLPGAEDLDIDHALATLDKWAGRVRFETDRHLYRVTDPRYAEHYRHSEAYFRTELLIQTLQQDLDVKYDMTATDNFSFMDSRVAFLHGMVPGPGRSASDTPGGTCASMPVLYVAVGRRLGYPLKLVTTKAHVFARWEGGDHPNPAWRERFNIEGAGEGFGSYSDEHYTQGRFAVSDHDVRLNRYLVSLSPAEELAQFLASRGHCGFDNSRFGFAAACYENACRLDTSRPAYQAWFLDAALRSDYHPSTPALAQLILQRRRHAATADRPMADGMPRPVRSQASPNPPLPAGIGAYPRQAAPAMTPDLQPFRAPHPLGGRLIHNPQPDPSRSLP